MKPPFKMIIENEIEQWRYDSFWWKEPETLKWLESFHSKGIFYDIGANIGIYSLYVASLHPEMKIYAFEPHVYNFMRLIENIDINKFKNIIPLIVAISDYKGFLNFPLKSKIMGSSGSELQGAYEFESEYTIATTSIDNLVIPDYMKIDTDGNEFDIINGSQKSLRFIKSILVEINNNEDFIIYTMGNAGFTNDNRFNKLPNHSTFRREKEGIKARNIVFTRK